MLMVNLFRHFGCVAILFFISSIILYSNKVLGSTSNEYCSDLCGFQISYIQGEGDVQGVKLGLYRDYTDSFESLQRTGLDITIGFEVSANYWRFGPDDKSDYNTVIAFSPIFTTAIGEIISTPITLEFGVGLSILDDTTFAGKNVSTHFQFEDRIGFIFDVEEALKINLRYLHYSNGGVKSPNPGLNFISIGFQYIF